MDYQLPQYHVHIYYKFESRLVEKVLENPVGWALKLYALINMGKNMDETLSCFPYLLMHFNRTKEALNTLGMYLESIPYMFKMENNNVSKFNNSEDINYYADLLFSKDMPETEFINADFRNYLYVNFYADMNVGGIYGDFGKNKVEITSLIRSNILSIRVFKDTIYLAVPSIDDNQERIQEIVKNYIES